MVVAEIGNNHEGNFDLAVRLMQEAARCRVDAVKFQTFRAENYVSRADVARFKRLKSFELSYDEFAKLAELAHSLNLLFYSTPFDLASAEFLAGVVDCFKVASGDINFYPLISRIAETGKPIVISTGASNLEQISRTVSFIRDRWVRLGVDGSLAVLHCVSSYPPPPEEVNLRAIAVLLEHFETVGYSDHTLGIEACLLAVAQGASIVEKHFTLDKNLSDFRDHQLSADPGEMKSLVELVRRSTVLLGRREKTVQPCEEAAVQAIRRSVVASRELPIGHCIEPTDLTWVRPAGGLNPGEENVLIGRMTKHRVACGERITLQDVG